MPSSTAYPEYLHFWTAASWSSSLVKQCSCFLLVLHVVMTWMTVAFHRCVAGWYLHSFKKLTQILYPLSSMKSENWAEHYPTNNKSL